MVNCIRKKEAFDKDSRGKLSLNYEGPYVMKMTFFGGPLILTTMDGEEFPLHVNSNAVKHILPNKKEPAKSKMRKGNLGKKGTS